jgi:hypothetical protein
MDEERHPIEVQSFSLQLWAETRRLLRAAQATRLRLLQAREELKLVREEIWGKPQPARDPE